MSFFTLNGMTLRVMRDKKIIVNAGINTTETKLFGNDANKSPSYLFNNGYTGIDFEIDILLRDTDLYDGKSVKTILNNIYQNMEKVRIVSGAIDVPDGDYYIREVKKEQEYNNQTKWTIKFKQDYNIDIRNQDKMKNSTGSTSLDNVLIKCELPLNKNTSGKSECISVLQQKLKTKGYYLFKEGVILDINGIYDSNLEDAVLQFQKEYQKEYNLKLSGEFDSETRDCLINL